MLSLPNERQYKNNIIYLHEENELEKALKKAID